MPKKTDLAQAAIESSGVLSALQAFTPAVVSTIFVGLDTDDSDIDIVCQHQEEATFRQVFTQAFESLPDFELLERPHYLVGRFTHAGFLIEVFSSTTPVERQTGYRHYQVMKKLCDLGSEAFKTKVKALKAAGMKTEPAIGNLLALTGDPYEAVLELEQWPEDKLAQRIQDSLAR